MSSGDGPMLMSLFVVFHVFAHYLPIKQTYEKWS